MLKYKFGGQDTGAAGDVKNHPIYAALEGLRKGNKEQVLGGTSVLFTAVMGTSLADPEGSVADYTHVVCGLLPRRLVPVLQQKVLGAGVYRPKATREAPSAEQ